MLALAPAFYPPDGYLDNNYLTDEWGPIWRPAGTRADVCALFEEYEGIKEILEKSNVEMDMLVGNHDTATKDLSTHSLHWLNAFTDLGGGFPQLRIIDKPTHNDLRDYVN